MYSLFHTDNKNRFGEVIDNFEENGWPLEDSLRVQTLDTRDEDEAEEEPGHLSRIQKNLLHSSCSGSRRVGDSHAYHVKLNTDGMEADATSIPSEVLDYCDFRIPLGRIRFNRREFSDLGTYCNGVNHPLLKWTYASAYPTKGEVYGHILWRLDRLLPIELSKLPLDQRPAGRYGGVQFEDDGGPGWRAIYSGEVHGYFSSCWNDFEKPTTWRYLDHMIPEWYDFFQPLVEQ